MKKLYILILSLLVLTFVVGCSNKEGIEEEIVGNDKDEYGCIGSAGYQYCPELEKCVRVWEEPCPSLQLPENTSGHGLAINQSTPYLMEKPMYKDNNGRLLDVEKVVSMRYPRCFSVYYNFLIDNQDQIEKVEVRVDINDWEPTLADFTRMGEVIFTEDECIYYHNGEVLENCINQTTIASVGNLRCCI
ncbi:MAG: hypothetical protein KAQ83_02620 [Nanoarchaeota archaeon]|nr:hypothetical protein [Nanoarchaeota archaeon]